MATPYCRSRLALPTRECQQYAILRTNRTYDLRDVANNRLDFHPDMRQHNPRNNLKYSACDNSFAHLAFWFTLILRRRLILDSGAQHRRAGAFCGFLAFKLLLTNGGFLSFLISFTRAKSRGCSARQAAPPRKRFLQPRGPACPWAKKLCECCEAAHWSHFGFLLFFFSSLVEPLWMCQRPFASLHRVCWEGRLFALDTWDFLGFGFFLGLGDGTRDASCASVHE